MDTRMNVDDFYLAGKNPEYDRVAKKLLASRKILAWILKYCVEEFKDSEIPDIRDRYIQGTPEVALTPVLPDETNAASRIRGENTEDALVTEGKVTFDIRFRAITPDDEPLELIINVEAQKDTRLAYPLLKRAVYYCSRLISSQYTVDFEQAHYEKVKKVYSIWLCMNTPDGRSGITRYRMEEKPEFGDYGVPEVTYDLLQVVMVYIGDGKRELGNRLLNLLSELFKSPDNAKTKMSKLKENYLIDLNQNEEGMVDTMCNLSVGVYEKGWNDACNEIWDKAWNVCRTDYLQKEQARKRQLISDLWEMHMDIPTIARLARCQEEEVCEITKELQF